MTVRLYVFPALLREFRRVHPQADIKIWAGATDKCIAVIRAGTADLGLLTLPIDEPDLVTVPRHRRGAPARHRAVTIRSRARSASSPPICTAQYFVLFESGSNTRRVHR